MKIRSTLAGAIFLSLAVRLIAADDDHWDDQFGAPGVDSVPVYCIVTNGADVYVGGQFAAAGSAISPGIARWDGTSWFEMGGGMSNSGIPSIVYGILPHGSDIYAAGYFTTAGGVAAKGVARWNGTNWSALGGGVNGIALAMQFIGNNLYVGGSFTTAGGVTATNIARWDGTNWFAVGTGLNDITNGFSANVTSLAVGTNGNLYAAGLFLNAGTSPMNNIARWDGTQWNSLAGGLATGTSPAVNDIKFRNGILYAAGAFQKAGAVNATNIAKWDGASWTAMGGGPAGTYNGISFVGTNIYIAGGFTNIAGSKILYAAHWTGSAWEALAPGPAGELSSAASCVGADGNYFYAGGSFTRAGNAGLIGIARWDGSQWSALNGAKTHGAWLSAREIRAFSSSDIYVGGGLLLAGGTVANRIAHWNGTGWEAMNGGLIAPPSATATAASIIQNGGLTYVGGFFTNAGGVAANNVAVWDGANWSPLGSGLNNNVNALVFHQGQLFAGGTFTARGDGTGSLHGIAVFDGSDWQDVPVISEWSTVNSFNALASDGNNLYVGGKFYIGWSTPPPPPITGDGLDNIGYWDGSSWHSMKPALGFTVNALAFYNGELYAGGSFTTNSAGTSLKRIARWTGSAWTAVGAGFTSGTVSALAANANALYAGGTFTNSSGIPLWRIAKWDGSTWSPLGSGLTNITSGVSVTGISLNGDDVYLAGTFFRAGGKPSLSIAHWNETVSFVPPIIQLLNPRWESGQFHFDIGGLSAGNFSVFASSNLTSWDAIYSNSVPDTNFADPDSASLPGRTYRVSSP